jgi:hypothetical protein
MDAMIDACTTQHLDDLGHGLLQQWLGPLLEPVPEAAVQVVGQVDGDQHARRRGIPVFPWNVVVGVVGVGVMVRGMGELIVVVECLGLGWWLGGWGGGVRRCFEAGAE